MRFKLIMAGIAIGALFWKEIRNAFSDTTNSEKKLTHKSEPGENNTIEKSAEDLEPKPQAESPESSAEEPKT